jgi:hypothetical protein
MKKLLLAIAMLALSCLPPFTAAQEYKLTESYSTLRARTLAAKPGSIGLKPARTEVWGVLMETARTDRVETLIALADGSVGLYASNGEASVPPRRTAPRKAAKVFLTASHPYLQYALRVEQFPLPQASRVRFYFLSGAGVAAVEASEDDLARGFHRLSPLFHLGQEVVESIRVAEAAQTAAPTAVPAAEPAAAPAAPSSPDRNTQGKPAD